MANDPLSSTSVLLVEDEKFSQRFVARILDKIAIAGGVVAGNGAAEIEHLNDEKSSIELIICDIEMPGMDGWEFVHIIRFGEVPQYKNVPILMLTGADTQKNVRRGKYHKVNAFLVKPPDVDTLRNRMLEALGVGTSASGGKPRHVAAPIRWPSSARRLRPPARQAA